MNIEIPRPNALDRIEEVAAGMAARHGKGRGVFAYDVTC